MVLGMRKIFSYNTKYLLLHTIFFIFASTIVAIYPIVKEDANQNYVLVSNIVLITYFFYILVGYVINVVNFLRLRIIEFGSLEGQIKTDNVFRVAIANTFGAFYAYIYGIINHIFLFVSMSAFYLFVAEIYYAISLIKTYLVCNVNRIKYYQNRVDKIVISFLFVLAISVVLCAITVYYNSGTFTKFSFLVFAYALYAFYALISGVISFSRAHKTHNIVRERFFIVKLACAIFSMYVLMVSLLNQFSTKPDLLPTYALIGGVVTGGLILTEAIIFLIWYIKNKQTNKKILQ